MDEERDSEERERERESARERDSIGERRARWSVGAPRAPETAIAVEHLAKIARMLLAAVVAQTFGADEQ